MSTGQLANEIEKRINADTGSRYVDSLFLQRAIDIITRFISVAYAFLSVTILILVPLIVVAEICYITIPFFRYSVDLLDQKTAQSKFLKKPFDLVFRDAITSVIEADTSNTGKSAVIIYVVKKVKSIMFIMFVVTMALQGSGPIIKLLTKWLSGVLDTIRNAL